MPMERHTCDFCDWTGPINSYPEHLQKCERAPRAVDSERAWTDGAPRVETGVAGTAAPSVVCSDCGPEAIREMTRVRHDVDDAAVRIAVRCPDCGATGTVVDRHGTNYRRYQGAAATRQQLDERQLAATLRSVGGGRR